MNLPVEVLPPPPVAQRTSPPQQGPTNLAPEPSGSRLPRLAYVYIMAFASLLASFPARNSDLWMHMAAGRRLAQAPSFAAALTLGDATASRGWLYDLLCYQIYEAIGGGGLVFVKALLAVGLALVLLDLSRSRAGWWLAAICTVLALLAMSTRLLVQPATVSCLFLALTLWLLERSGREWLLPPWSLLPLFVLWVNLDSWFLLGLGAVALVGIGRILDEPSQALRKTLNLAVWLILLAAACLVNPAHVHAFAVLGDAAALGNSLGAAASTAQVSSPFEKSYFATVGLTPAGLAYFPLLGLGLFSFVLALPRWHWQRLLPWLGPAVLSIVQVRTIPFFAVVAAPVLAWNLHEFFARHSESERQQGLYWGQALLVLRTLTVLLGAVFFVCAWPGWLQAPPFEPRRWAVEPAPALEQGAGVTRRWHEEGKLTPDDRALHLSPATASAFAWFCPEDQGVLDEELTGILFGDSGTVASWDLRARQAGITHIVVYEPERDRLLRVLDRLLSDPTQWPLLYLEGDLAVFGWRDPSKPQEADRFRGWELDVDRLAFHPAKDRQAPAKAADNGPELRPWWDAFWKPAPPRLIDRDEATLHLLHAEALRRSAPLRHLASWEAAEAAGLIGSAASWTPPGCLADAHTRLVLYRPPLPQPGSTERQFAPLVYLALKWQQLYTLQRDDTPPALLYLAVRDARRALAVNPQDAQAYLVLGESYLGLLHSTRERVWGERMRDLLQLRQLQASAALNQAVALKPSLTQAQLALSGLYREMGCLDLALTHLRTYCTLVREAGPPPGSDPQQFREQRAVYEEELSRLATVVEDRESQYAAEAGHYRVLDRATLATDKGLVGKARDLLLETDVSAFGFQGIALELGLLLKTGRPQDVLAWTDATHEAALGSATYHRLRASALAASGDYAAALDEFAELDRGDPVLDPRFRQSIVLMGGQAVLAPIHAGTRTVPTLVWQGFLQFQLASGAARLASSMRQRADQFVIRGLLALEQGNVDEAQDFFRLALASCRKEPGTPPGSGIDFTGMPVAHTCLEWLK
jgi:tetratricopeptide (TPR) repeat protein